VGAWEYVYEVAQKSKMKTLKVCVNVRPVWLVGSTAIGEAGFEAFSGWCLPGLEVDIWGNLH
jgi:hypothetical protein